MSQSFSFPPPPPPPPKPVTTGQHNTYPQYGGRGGQRGRGNFAEPSQNGRGYGNRGGFQHQPRGSQRGSYSHRGNGMNFQANGHVQQYQNFAPPDQSSRNQSYNPPQKRTYASAFSNRPNNTQQDTATSRPLAPPAVPSFGIDLENLLPKKAPSTQTTKLAPSRKQNLLGLTPTAKDEDSESDDEGEEDKLSRIIASNSLLQFEYRGHTSTLNTPAEVAAWIAERRKRWPTEVKREVARKEVEEKRKKWEAEKAARLEASKAAAKSRQEERQKQKLEREKSQVRQKLIREQIQKAKTQAAPKEGPKETQTAAQVKAERLRRKAEKIAAQLKQAEEVLQKQEQQQKKTEDGENTGGQGDADLEKLLAKVDRVAEAQANGIELNVSETSASNSEPDPEVDPTALADDTSSSGSSSSDSGSDSLPEQFSTKRNAPDRIHQPGRKAVPDTRPLCNNFAKSGRCKYGRRCHYRHEKPDRKALQQAKESGSGNRRKGLYKVMVEKEQEEERKRALRVIIALGDAGLLNDAATVDAGVAVNAT